VRIGGSTSTIRANHWSLIYNLGSVDLDGRKLMTLQEVQKQALQLPINARWQLVQTLLESLQQETRIVKKKGNLSRLRGIAKSTIVLQDEDVSAYTTYLTEKYQ
jgi:hypothetical protein